ncbi:MAG: hypothetical protein L3K02_04820, partial [Thermoplasmata archaeon]|nr:hypothetical protein [Thermoplasmata archaeon]
MPANVLAILVGILVGASSVGAAFVLETHLPRSTTPPGSPPSNGCSASDPAVADPSAPHGAFILDPPTDRHDAYYADLQTYLLNNPVLCGADFWVPWNTVDAGPQAQPEYNFSAVDAEAAPWTAVGKEVNLIFELEGTSSGSQFVPSSILAEVPTLQCGNSAVTPAEWNGTLTTAYRAFIAAAVHHYDTLPGIGYLRFGFGVAGETAP